MPSEPFPVLYLVLVHGMGRQRRFESLVEPLGALAEALADGPAPPSPVALGEVVTTRPWVEFEGLPAYGKPFAPFDGTPSVSGLNVRLTEVWWADLLQEGASESGEAADRWADRIASRLLTRVERYGHLVGPDGPAADEILPFWLTHQLRLLRTLVRFTRPLMRRLHPRTEEVVFREYLGDVQALTQSPLVRARAVRRFHETLDRVHAAHETAEAERGSPRPARFVVLAHSLGSALAFEALLWARAPAPWREGRDGYAGPAGPSVCAWNGSVDGLVTVGSPLDKLVAFWPDNFRHHLDPAFRAAESRLAPIPHLNLLEEQDLVADPLLAVRASPAYGGTFTQAPPGGPWAPPGERMLVGAHPVAAHVGYLGDRRVLEAALALARARVPGAAPLPARAPASMRPGGPDATGSDLGLPLVFGLLTAACVRALMAAEALWAIPLLALAVVACVLVGGSVISLLAWVFAVRAGQRPSSPVEPRPALPGAWLALGWIAFLLTSAASGCWLAGAGGDPPVGPLLALFLALLITGCVRFAVRHATLWSFLLVTTLTSGLLAIGLRLVGGLFGVSRPLLADPSRLAVAALSGGLALALAVRALWGSDARGAPTAAPRLAPALRAAGGRRARPLLQRTSWSAAYTSYGPAAAVWLAGLALCHLLTPEPAASGAPPGASPPPGAWLLRHAGAGLSWLHDSGLVAPLFVAFTTAAALSTQARYQRALARRWLGTPWSRWRDRWTAGSGGAFQAWVGGGASASAGERHGEGVPPPMGVRGPRGS